MVIDMGVLFELCKTGFIISAMAGGLGVLFGKDPLNLPLEDQISFAAQVIIVDHHHLRIRDLRKPDVAVHTILIMMVTTLERMKADQ